MRRLALFLLFPLAVACSQDDPAEPAGTATGDEPAEDMTPAEDTQSTEDVPETVPEEKPVTVDAPMSWVSDPTRLPFAVHMTWQQDPSSTISFSWATADTNVEAYKPWVWVVPKAELADGKMPYFSEWVAAGDGIAYQLSVNGVAIEDDMYVNWTVEVTGLEPKTEYVYRVGTWAGFDEETGRFDTPELSEMLSFTTGVPKGERAPFKFVMAGDSRGGTDAIRQNIERMKTAEVGMWFFNGDMTNGGTPKEWMDWWDAMEPLTRERVFMPVQGNHEIFADVYYNQFALPVMGAELPDELAEGAWSIDYGNVHFIGLNSNTKSLAEEQLDWLEADLEQASSDPDTDFIIAMMHHPTYSASTVHGSTSWVQQTFLPLFEKYSVDFVFAGHDHVYERTVPVRGDAQVADGEGTVYVVAGGFFSPPYKNGKKWFTDVSVHGDPGNWVVVEVDGKTLTLTAYPTAGGPNTPGMEPLDTYTLTKP